MMIFLSRGDATIDTYYAACDKVVFQQEVHSLCDISAGSNPVQWMHSSSLFSGVCTAVIALLKYRHTRVYNTGCNSGYVDTFTGVFEGC